MPAWVVVLTRDSIRSVAIESAVRDAGFSPRRAPDLARLEVLLRQGDPPAAAVVDLDSTGRDGLDGVRRLARDLPVAALAASARQDLLQLAARTGAEPIADADVERLRAMLDGIGS